MFIAWAADTSLNGTTEAQISWWRCVRCGELFKYDFLEAVRSDGPVCCSCEKELKGKDR